MPIKFQCLGGGGGLMELVVETSKPNTKVTITKGDDVRSFVSNDLGIVICKLQLGTYLIKAEYENGKIAQQEITLSNQEEANLRITDQIGNLEVGAKLKFSSGKKFILKSKGSAGHENNTSIFISERVTEQAELRKGNLISSIYANVLPRYYNELTLVEKSAIVTRTVTKNLTYIGGDGCRYTYYSLSDDVSQFYILSETELGIKSGRPQKYENLGFNSDSERIKKDSTDTAKSYYISNTFENCYGDYTVYVIDGTGKRVSIGVGENTPVNKWILPCCDLKNDAKVSLDTDGYWFIVA